MSFAASTPLPAARYVKYCMDTSFKFVSIPVYMYINYQTMRRDRQLIVQIEGYKYDNGIGSYGISITRPHREREGAYSTLKHYRVGK